MEKKNYGGGWSKTHLITRVGVKVHLAPSSTIIFASMPNSPKSLLLDRAYYFWTWRHLRERIFNLQVAISSADDVIDKLNWNNSNLGTWSGRFPLILAFQKQKQEIFDRRDETGRRFFSFRGRANLCLNWRKVETRNRRSLTMSGGRRSMGKRIHIGGYAEVMSLNIEDILIHQGFFLTNFRWIWA